MEDCRHIADPEDRHADASERLPADFNHADLVAHARAVRRPCLYLSGTRPYSSRVRHLTSATSSRLDRQAR